MDLSVERILSNVDQRDMGSSSWGARRGCSAGRETASEVVFPTDNGPLATIPFRFSAVPLGRNRDNRLVSLFALQADRIQEC